MDSRENMEESLVDIFVRRKKLEAEIAAVQKAYDEGELDSLKDIQDFLDEQYYFFPELSRKSTEQLKSIFSIA